MENVGKYIPYLDPMGFFIFSVFLGGEIITWVYSFSPTFQVVLISNWKLVISKANLFWLADFIVTTP